MFVTQLHQYRCGSQSGTSDSSAAVDHDAPPITNLRGKLGNKSSECKRVRWRAAVGDREIRELEAGFVRDLLLVCKFQLHGFSSLEQGYERGGSQPAQSLEFVPQPITASRTGHDSQEAGSVGLDPIDLRKHRGNLICWLADVSGECHGSPRGEAACAPHRNAVPPGSGVGSDPEARAGCPRGRLCVRRTRLTYSRAGHSHPRARAATKATWARCVSGMPMPS
jgi:hypothetical protein